jgi:hypothetical protein
MGKWKNVDEKHILKLIAIVLLIEFCVSDHVTNFIVWKPKTLLHLAFEKVGCDNLGHYVVLECLYQAAY